MANPILVLVLLLLAGVAMSEATDYWVRDNVKQVLSPGSFNDTVNVTRMKINNQLVCLADGTNCQATNVSASNNVTTSLYLNYAKNCQVTNTSKNGKLQCTTLSLGQSNITSYLSIPRWKINESLQWIAIGLRLQQGDLTSLRTSNATLYARELADNTSQNNYLQSYYYNKTTINSLIPAQVTLHFHNTTSASNSSWKTMDTTYDATLSIETYSGLVNGQVIVKRYWNNTKLTMIDDGLLSFSNTVKKTAGIRDLQVYGILYARHTNGSVTQITRTSSSALLTTGVTTSLFTTSQIPQTNLNRTDNLLWTLIANVTGAGTAPTIQITTGNTVGGKITLPVVISSVIEQDPVFVANRTSIWTAINNRLLISTWKVNESQQNARINALNNSLTPIPTLVMKMGSRGGTVYSTTSATYIDVDKTNLSYTTTIPSGYKMLINAYFDGYSSGGSHVEAVGIANGTGTRTTLVEIDTIWNIVVGGALPLSLAYVWNGTGTTQTFRLRYHNNGAGTTGILNDLSTGANKRYAVMTFLMVKSN